MSLASIVKGIKRAETLIFTPRIEAWLREHPEGIVWDDNALGLWEDLVRRSGSNDDRSGRFGASSRGTCHRRQVFSFLGMPELRVIAPETLNLFLDGKMRHLKWQMMGLQSGALTHAEHPTRHTKYRLKVSMDGLNADEQWLAEFKGDRDWSRALAGVPEPHLLQVHSMFLATGWDVAVYVIESKSSNEWREIIIRRDPALMTRVREELEVLNDHVEDHVLPDVLPACQTKQGPYRQCPFGPECLRRAAEGDQWPDRPGDWES